MIHVEEEALNELKQALTTAGEDYKTNLARLTVLIEEITSGDIQGDSANDLLAKFQAHKDTFDKVTRTIEEAEEYAGIQKTSFVQKVSEVASSMK